MLAAIHPALTSTHMSTLGAAVELQGVPARYAAFVFGGLGVLALLMATVGLYAVVAYMVSLRCREIGIRMALGARRRDVVCMVLGHSLRLTVYGTLTGLLPAAPLTFAMRAVIVGVHLADPRAMCGTVALFVATAVAAAGLPARRAASVDPVRAIRYE